MVARDIILAELTGGRYHIAHLSTRGRAWTWCAAARRAGCASPARSRPTTCSSPTRRCAKSGYDTNTKMNPPLRSEEDREALIDGLARRHGRLHRHRPRAAHRGREGRVEFDRGRLRHRGAGDGARALPGPPGAAGPDQPARGWSSCSRPARARVLGLPGGTLDAGSARGRDRPRPLAPAEGRPRALPEQVAQHAVRRVDAEGRAGRSPSSAAASPGGTAASRAAVADPAADYNRLVERDPGAAREQAQWLEEAFRRAGITFDGAPMRTCLRPHFVAQAEWDTLADGGTAADGDRVARRAPRIRRGRGRSLRLPGHAGGGGALGPPRPRTAGRPALAAGRVPGRGRHRASSRSTATRPPASATGTGWRRCSRTCPLFRAFAETRRVRYEPSLPALVDAVVWTWRKTGRPAAASPVIAIADWADVKTRADQEIVCARFEAVGFDCVLADPRAMEISGGRLVANGRPVDLVYRRAVLTEIVEREGQMQPFLEAYRDGLAVFVNSFRCRLSEDKAFFAILTDEAFASLMTAEESRARRAAVVPWTRRVAERKTLRGGKRDRPRAVRDRATGTSSCSSPRTATAAARCWWGTRPRRKPGRPRSRTACASRGSCRRGCTSRRRCSRVLEDDGEVGLVAPQGEREPVLRGRRGRGRGDAGLPQLRHQRQRGRRQRPDLRRRVTRRARVVLAVAATASLVGGRPAGLGGRRGARPSGRARDAGSLRALAPAAPAHRRADRPARRLVPERSRPARRGRRAHERPEPRPRGHPGRPRHPRRAARKVRPSGRRRPPASPACARPLV